MEEELISLSAKAIHYELNELYDLAIVQYNIILKSTKDPLFKSLIEDSKKICVEKNENKRSLYLY